jgi:hypothetical protein
MTFGMFAPKIVATAASWAPQTAFCAPVEIQKCSRRFALQRHSPMLYVEALARG